MFADIMKTCPGCSSADTAIFYRTDAVPVHSVLLFTTREKAIAYPRRDIQLAFCRNCGFIFNAAFDPRALEYSPEYESSQAFSPTFNRFAHDLAERLVERYGLRGKDILEIGCGNGEFISLLCEIGGNRGVGFDPAFQEYRGKGNHVTFVRDFYSEQYRDYRADFLCCKMTLEHIPDTGNFVGMVRRAIGDGDTVVFFQIPEMRRILRDVAFWDIYYEHCSYFSRGSLSRLFAGCGFKVIEVWTEYDDQYLMIAAAPAHTGSGGEDDLQTLAAEVDYFAQSSRRRIETWKRRVRDLNGQRVVLWGSSSKGVAFLTTLGVEREIEYVVDVNPYRQGHYMPGTGQKIVSPAFLKEYRPELVILMNSIYLKEIEGTLGELGLSTEVVAV